jgi:hypothetical protein
MRDSVSLGEARNWLRERVDEGESCPLCSQFAKVYRRKIHSTMARDLIRLYREVGADEWVHVPTVLGSSGGDLAKTVYWGLIEELPGVREDGSTRVGWWSITQLGKFYVLGRVLVPKYARIYNGRLLDLVGDRVGIQDALGDKFNYSELMMA